MAKPLFEHRHYVEIARIIANLPPTIRGNVVTAFANELRGTNPKFDAYRFERAADGEPVARDR